MYRLPSMSKRYAPWPRSKKIGSPPTPPNARAGLFTPPGMRDLARAKAAELFVRDIQRGMRSSELGKTIGAPHRQSIFVLELVFDHNVVVRPGAAVGAE